jgi:hypothetical protein
MELNGRLKEVFETKDISPRFRKRELVLTTEEQYPQHILIEFVQDNCDKLNGFKVGDEVTIGINIRGREWQSPQGETKYFNSIQGWRISTKTTTQDPTSSNNDSGPSTPPPTQWDSDATSADDDLPF